MPKTKKLKNKKNRKTNPLNPGGCCTVGGPPAPDYVNPHIGGAAPAPHKYIDSPAIRRVQCVYATRVTAANAVRYDGRLWTRPLLFTAAQINSFKRVKRSQHQLRELVKGLLFERPELEHASRDQLFVEVVNQLIHSGKKVPKVPRNWADALRLLATYMPVGGIAGAMALMRRHDADVEIQLNDSFWAKHLPGRPAPTNLAERQALVRDFVKRRWQATARSARTQVDTANGLVQRFPCALYKAPTLGVVKRGRRGRPGTGPLTDFDILSI